MDLTSRQRLLAFALIVLAVVGVGTFLFITGTEKHNTASPPAHPSTPSTTYSSPAAAPSTPVQPTGSTAASSQVNIYQWLPFNESQLAQASNVVQEFSAYYGTYSYNESTSSYINRMSSLANSQLLKVIQSAYTAPGVAGLRSQQKQVSAGTAVINSLRTFGPDSITFVVTVDQKITQNNGTSQQSNQYAVTVASTGAGWQVNNIELASQGNQ
ncbi:MAG: hypothetical protein ACRDNF_22255 [Streptosporangiaceae bacterium]